MPLLDYPAGIWIGLVGLAPAGLATLLVWRYPDDTPRLIRAQGSTLVAFLMFSLGSGLGLLSP